MTATAAELAVLARAAQWELDAFAFEAPRGVTVERCRCVAGGLELLAAQIRAYGDPDHTLEGKL